MMRKKMIWPLVFILMVCFTSIAMAESGEETVSRLDFLKNVMDIRNFELKESVSSSFQDVTDSKDIPYVEAAYNGNIICGYQGNFRPESFVTKEEAITMLVKALGDIGSVNKITESEQKNILLFDDQASISSWARPFVAYGCIKGVIPQDTRIFDPKSLLTCKEADLLIEKAKQYYTDQLTREGLNASEMLEKSAEKMDGFDTYKYNGTMNMETKVSGTIEGQAEEENIKMVVDSEGVFEKPQKIYGKSQTTIISQTDEPQKQVSEVLMNNGMMYLKAGDAEKWIKMDMNPLMQEIQKFTGNSDMMNMGLSKEQMELIGIYASYGKDATINDKEHYVIDVYVDEDSFKKMYKGIIDKTMEMMMDQAETANNNLQQEDALTQPSPKAIAMMIENMLNNMNVRVSYKFYIDKESKCYSNMETCQSVMLDFNGITSQTVANGQYKYHGFNEKVTFPTIKDEDIQDINTAVQEPIQ